MLPNHCGVFYGRLIATAEQQESQTHASLTNTERSATTLPFPPPYLTCYLDLHKAQDSYNGLIWGSAPVTIVLSMCAASTVQRVTSAVKSARDVMI